MQMAAGRLSKLSLIAFMPSPPAAAMSDARYRRTCVCTMRCQSETPHHVISPIIDQAPQQRHRQKIHSVPMSARNGPRCNSADDQKRHNAAGKNVPFFSAPSQNHLPEWVSVCKAYHTEKPIARKAATSIPLARFSGIGIAVWDPIWFAGQEEGTRSGGRNLKRIHYTA